MKSVLVVVDMQNDFVDGALGTPEALAIVPKVVEKIRSFSGDIFVTFDTHFADYSETLEGKYLPVPHCIKGTSGWNLNSEVENALAGRDHQRLEKITFGSVDLPEQVRAIAGEGDLSVQLVGLCTDICVVSNALLLKAHFPQAEISVDASCCAGVTAESHKAALLTMKMCQIQVID